MKISDVIKILNSIKDNDENQEILKKDQDLQEYNGEKVMAFLMKGFIFVGNLYSKGEYCILKNALNCRSQSMGKGWGYIAKQGQQSCVIDDYTSNDLKFHKYQLLFTQEVDPAKWSANE